MAENKKKNKTQESSPESKGEKKKNKSPRRKSTSVTKAVLQERLKAAEEEIGQLKDRLLRTAAELDNVKKRTERETAQLIESANSRLILSLLPVLDDFDRSLHPDHAEMSADDFRQGVELIYRKLTDQLVNAGLEPMESVNAPFDVHRHDALLQVEKEGVEPGMVVDEHLKGYLLKGNVLRHAQVVVSK